MSTPRTSREIRLAARPEGPPAPSDFALVEVDLPDLAEGQVLVANHVMSVDPYMRGRMADRPSYVPPFRLDRALDGAAVGVVVESRSPALTEGDVVVHGLGWREHAVLAADRARRIEPDGLVPSAWLGVLGVPGLTAWAGLTAIAPVRTGDVVFVSGAAGAVGSAAVQMARTLGASRVIGSAGSPAKLAWLRSLGVDDVFDYHDAPVHRQLRTAAPDGIDVYFDNVGGEHLEAAVGALRPHGRVALCGAISQYNATAPTPGPRNLALAIGKRLSLRGFIVTDHEDLREEFEADARRQIAAGTLQWQETVVTGLDNAPAAFIGLLQGDNIGKMVVDVSGGQA